MPAAPPLTINIAKLHRIKKLNGLCYVQQHSKRFYELLMKYIRYLLLLVSSASLAQTPVAVYQSSEQQSQVIEVFTSEGCSSCPPADAWLSTFKDDPKLFTEVIPMAFHVDYWDWLGWKDRFASPLFSQRQRDYVKQRNLSQAYTPGILVNSEEWRAWFKGERYWPKSNAKPGQLTLEVRKKDAQVTFESTKPLNAHFAVLGLGIASSVTNGENRGKALRHDFVVIHHQTLRLSESTMFSLPDRASFSYTEKLAVVGWVSEQGKPAILQAAAGYWPTGE